MNSIKVTMILTGSEAGRRCVSSEAEIGVVGVVYGESQEPGAVSSLG